MRPVTVISALVRASIGILLVLLFTILIYSSAALIFTPPVDTPLILFEYTSTDQVNDEVVSPLPITHHHPLQNAVIKEKAATVSTESITSRPPDIISTQSVREMVSSSSNDHNSTNEESNERFQTSNRFTWPQPRAVRSVNDISSELWWKQLQNCLKRLESREVILLTSNQPYTEVLLNWLIAAVKKASVNLNKVIVIAMDSKLHSLLEEKGITSVLVKPKSLLTTATLKEGIFPAVMMTRLSIIRLINHWGYHVFNFDTDAVLLRDPFPLLSSRDDIIGTFGRFPRDLTKKWGITLCTAVLVVHSSKQTEEFWGTVSQVAHSSFSDQGKMNYGLQAMRIQWSLQSCNLGSLTQPVHGEGRNRLRVSLLPYNVACRAGSCTHKALSNGLYVWHKGGERQGERKREGAEGGGAWLLRHDWTISCEGMKGRQWLQCISN